MCQLQSCREDAYNCLPSQREKEGVVMAVYVDEMRRWRDRRINFDSCHLLADTDAELEAFAIQIGVSTCWKHRDHYDISELYRKRALAAGAIETTAYHLACLRKILREAASDKKV